MRADLEMFRERLDERRARDEAARAGRGPGPSVQPATPEAPRRGVVEDDDEFYRPRSWLV
ncbi:hypothetical protein [Rhodococcus sp. 3A]|nr:hypothetical protein [Rhodococcus sp. 3A]MBC2643396.1 hypothetical protein [Rhodococcus sp. 3A]MBC2891864.1 hypothetical protein [Rhodococcus sp. 4CII]